METKTVIEATCPDCSGPLSEVEYDGQLVEYRCLIGHAYSPRNVLRANSDTAERAMWRAVMLLEQSAILARLVLPHLPAIADRLESQVEKKLKQAAEIRKIIQELEPFQTD
jgi:two-component system chemotaxis response regulator CheB